jgi:hypothetical protein
MPRLLVDSDIFCKLGITGLLEPSAAIFGVSLADCACLPALPHMLRRGKLPRLFGVAECEALIPLAERLTAMPVATASLDKLANVDRIDVGEAHIFAAVADLGMVALTGDKRALAAVAQVPDFPQLLAGKIATLEAVLLSLCGSLGEVVVRDALKPILARDQTLRVCFSTGNHDPRAGLHSYFEALKRDVLPLELWAPLEEQR